MNILRRMQFTSFRCWICAIASGDSERAMSSFPHVKQWYDRALKHGQTNCSLRAYGTGTASQLSSLQIVTWKPKRRPWNVFYTELVQKLNSLTYNLVAVSGHNLESSQTWGFCMDFLSLGEGGVVFYQVFRLTPLQCTVTQCRNCKRLREFEEIEISRQSCKRGCE